jgi:uncharacterized membrane protein
MAAIQHLEHSIVVHVPVGTAYNQWTQFESFPAFMQGVEEVRQVDDTHLHWRATIGGKTLEWNAEIVQQVPDQLVAWRSTTGTPNRGEVHFVSQGPTQTLVRLVIEYTPEGTLEALGAAMGSVNRRIKSDLERFKEFIERQGAETGRWRGTVVAGEVTHEPAERFTRAGQETDGNPDQAMRREPPAGDDVLPGRNL